MTGTPFDDLITRAISDAGPAPAEEEPAPLALTDQHIAALARAIESEGYRIMVDTETGEVKLKRTV